MSELTPKVSLANLARGGLEERFQAAFLELLANIADPNTDAKAARKVVITLVFKPAESREEAAMTAKVETRLQALSPVGSTVFLGWDARTGQMAGREFDPRQQDLEFDVVAVGQVTRETKKGAN